MFCENNVELRVSNAIKQTVEAKVIESLKKEEYTLNTVNSYGENLVHVSAANGCLNIIKEILQKWDTNNVIDRKSKFGWTPLMLAIRNRDIETVKFLLEKNVNVNESTYLGMSVLGLAAAINRDMFEIVYEVCPLALCNSMNDDITPLCIAAMKNDKDLFFRLLELGFEVSKSNEYTQVMMKQSVVPEIRNLANIHLDVEEYWNDVSDNISVEQDVENKCDIKNLNNNNNLLVSNNRTKPIFISIPSECDDKESNNNVAMDLNKYLKPCNLKLISEELGCVSQSVISPTLTCSFNEILPQSPNIHFIQNKQDEKMNFNVMSNAESKQSIQDEDAITCLKNSNNKNNLSAPHLQRLQSICPPNLNIQVKLDLDTTLGYIPEFSPLRSPNVPPDINDENVFGESTPTPPRYKTPPRGMILNLEEAKMCVLLKQYGLSQHIPIFIEQEIDVDLFLTLTDDDLVEIGIQNESNRKMILNVIEDCRKSMI